jgi:acetyl esterase
LIPAPPALTPQMASVLEAVRRADRPTFYSMSVEQARLAYEAASEVLELPRAPLARVENFSIAASDGSPLRARLYAASKDALPIALYLHGGGFTIGNLETHDSLCRQLAKRSGVAIVAVEYRLAPEHRFPCAVFDSCSALQWLAQHGWAALGLDATRLAVAGDSAGGTLAAVCAIQARDAALPLRLQILITPGTAPRQDSDSHRRFATGFLLEAAGIEWFFNHYIDSDRRTDWRFAPLNAPDLGGVAPACVIVAECDPLVDEGLAFADRLRLSRVPVRLEHYRGVTHDFIKMGRALPEAPAAQAVIAQCLQEAFSA